MTKQATRPDQAILELSIDCLELTLTTTQRVKAQGIETIGQLVEKTSAGTDELGLERKREVEVREVLASRGL